MSSRNVVGKKLFSRVDLLMRRVPTMKLMKRLWFIPPLLPFRQRRYAPIKGSWLPSSPTIPSALGSVPGIARDSKAEIDADVMEPLRHWGRRYPEVAERIYSLGWSHFIPIAPRRGRANRQLKAMERTRVTGCDRRESDPQELTAAFKRFAAELGISACGVAERDPKYTYAEFRAPETGYSEVGNRVVVCVLEANRHAIQTAPSSLAEKAQLEASTQLIRMLIPLQSFLRSRGYDVRDNTGEGIAIQYAVESGLGQLGLNGQLLTPHAGSRVRLLTFVTNAPLIPDEPIDYGLTKICDSCRICVRRCPPAAITSVRKWHRGVYKAKISLERCVPVVAQVHGCAVCTKTCPIQQYGLAAVLEEWERTGSVLGKGTDLLEGYEFEGAFYGVGERPRLREEFFAKVPVHMVERVSKGSEETAEELNL
jgi:epoxyqueuosine reductase